MHIVDVLRLRRVAETKPTQLFESRLGGEGLALNNARSAFPERDDWQSGTIGLALPTIVTVPPDPSWLWLGDSAAGAYTSDAGGASWEKKQSGLPTEDCFFTVLRQAMSTDRRDPAGVYFGTNSGSVIASMDEGESWVEIARHLPTVLCVVTVQR